MSKLPNFPVEVTYYKSRKFPVKVTWRNSGYDTPITLVGEYGEFGGVTYFRAESGTGIPGNEIIWPSRLTRLKRWLKIEK